MIITLFLLCSFIILLYYFLCYAKFVRLINKIPSKQAFPVLGHVVDVTSRDELWNYHPTLCKNYYPISKFWLGPIALVSIQHPNDLETYVREFCEHKFRVGTGSDIILRCIYSKFVQKILTSTKEHLSKGYIYTAFYPWLGTGLRTSEGIKWHKRRKILTSTFHFNILKQFVEIMIQEGNCMTKFLKDTKMSTVSDLMQFVSHYTLNVICETAMGTSLQDMGEFHQQYREAVHEMGKLIVYRAMRPWLASHTIFALTSRGKNHAKYLKILHGFTEKIIAERKQYHENTGGRYLKDFEDDTETDDNELIKIKKKRLAMLDLLILAARNGEMNDLDIREEVDTLMFEGHNTVAASLTCTMLLLAEHKDVQECVRNEIRTVMQANEEKLTMSMLNNMPYLERCLKESLRLYPSIPIISRVLSQDVKLQSYLVPSGTTLYMSIHDLHRDPNFWPNPNVFDPDRFLSEKIQNRHSYSYLPFSAGPRNCIGQRFAMLEMKAIIAPLVYNFYLEPIDYLKNLRFTTSIVNSDTLPICIRFVPIDRMASDSS